MNDVATSVDVCVPVRTAYDKWARFESFPRFMSGVRAVQQIDDRHTHWVTEIGGVRREFDAEIVEQRRDERIAWQSTDGDTRHAGVVTFQPLGADQTRVTVEISWEPQGLMEKAGSVLGVDEYQVRMDAERFKEYVEAG